MYDTLNMGEGSNDYSAILLRLAYVKKEKAIYNELNKLKQSELLFHGMFWTPKNNGQLKELINWFMMQRDA